MGISAIISIASLAVTTAGTIASISSSHQAAQAQNQALQLQTQQANLQAAQQQRQSIRESRIAYANAQNNANNTGSAQSSSAQGGQASIKSQLDSNLSFLDTYNTLSDMAGHALGQANIFKSNAETFGTIASAAGDIFKNSSQIATLFAPKVAKVGG